MPLYLNYPQWIRPQVIPGFPLYWYGVMYIVAFVITYLLFMYQVKKGELDAQQDDVTLMFLWIVIPALIFARIFATTVYDLTGKYLRAPWLIFWPFDADMNFTGFSGMSFFGGLTGGMIGILLWKLKYKKDLLAWSDVFVHGLPLGYTFGRLGNFINGELYGRITSSPIGMIFPNARQVSVQDPGAQELIQELNFPVAIGQVSINLPRHPSQLYEAFAEGILLWLVLWFIARPKKPFKGFSSALYIIGYSLTRFIVEFFRELDSGFDFYTPLKLSLGQLFCLLGILVGVIMLIIFARKHKQRPMVQTFS